MEDQPSQFQARYKDRGPAPRPALGKLFEQPLPHSLEAEMALLGSMLLDPEVIPDVIPLVGAREDFHLESHSAIFDSIIEIYDRHKTGDLVLILDALRTQNKLDLIGGDAYLLQLAEGVPSAANATYYAKIVAEKAKLRRLVMAAETILYDAMNVGDVGAGPEGAKAVLDKAEAAIFKIAEQDEKGDPQRLADLLEVELERIRQAEGVGISGVPTGFADLDKLLSGLQRGEMLILAARPSMGKCLVADSQITLRDGRVSTIEELVRARTGEVPTLTENLTLDWATPSAFIDDGLKPAFEVRTRLGKRVRTTLTHPFLTIHGWRPLAQLSVGQHIAVPRRLEAFGQSPMRDCEIKLLAYLIGDGGLTSPTPRFTSASPRVAADFQASVREFGPLQIRLSSSRQGEAPSWRIGRDSDDTSQQRAHFAAALARAIKQSGRTQRDIAQLVGVSPGSITHWVSSTTVPDQETFAKLCVVLHVTPADLAPSGLARLQQNAPNPLSQWLEHHSLMGRGSHDKCIPPAIFSLPREQLALFLNRLFATDGWATVLAPSQCQLGYATVNERLARQVQHLLLRFGVIASLRHRWVKYRDARRSAWQLDITDALSIRRFTEECGIFAKEEALERVAQALAAKPYRTNRDLIPREAWAEVARAKADWSWSELARRIGARSNLHVNQRAISRARMAKFADATNDARLHALATSHVYWDEIVAIEPLGPRQVYDLTIDATHNFVADDVCVHNTAFALNLAEQVSRGGITPFDRDDNRRIPVGVFSLEMSKAAVSQRLLSAFADVDSHKIRTGEVSKAELSRLELASSESLSTLPLYIDDTPGLSILGLRSRARRMRDRHRIEVIFIDYLQLLSAPGSARESRQVEVSAISRGIKALARELNVPIVCLSQLNRASEQREGNRPRMSDLRESGSIEQDADVVMLLHREDYYHTSDPNWAHENPDKIGLAEIIIAKQRNGPTGTVKLTWDSKITRFKSHTESGGLGSGGFGSNRGGAYSGLGAPDPFNGYGSPPEPKPDPGSYAPQSPSRPSFPAGPRTGPVQDFRDGGGPDSDEEAAPF